MRKTRLVPHNAGEAIIPGEAVLFGGINTILNYSGMEFVREDFTSFFIRQPESANFSEKNNCFLSGEH